MRLISEIWWDTNQYANLFHGNWSEDITKSFALFEEDTKKYAAVIENSLESITT